MIIRWCSTPFGIIVRSTALSVGARAGVGFVLNAFRHHCSFHQSSRSAVKVRAACAQRLSASLFVPQCSTNRCDHYSSRAQRLSASLFVPQQAHLPSAVGWGVLNAFRHHCSFHFLDALRAERIESVLNAFRHHCSFHLVRFKQSPKFVLVLNAFRHHCSFHWCRKADGEIAHAVLNAFRHHCSFHSEMSVWVIPQLRCSTPFGIIVRSTHIQHATEHAAAQVLNAFRHHCSFHRRALRMAGQFLACSTPFGIIVRSTLNRSI